MTYNEIMSILEPNSGYSEEVKAQVSFYVMVSYVTGAGSRVVSSGKAVISSAKQGASSLWGKVKDGASAIKNAFTKNSIYSDYAMQATRNAGSSEVVLGKFNQGGVSYVQVAVDRGATYFQLDDWNKVVKEVGESKIWQINKQFLEQQIHAGKTFILSHDPVKATGYFASEFP
jgi:hypothetical protein